MSTKVRTDRHDAAKTRSSKSQRIKLVGIFYDVSRKPFYKDMSSIRLLNYLMESDDKLTVVLPIGRLYATQTHVNDDYHKVANRYRPTDSDAIPSVVKFEGKFYVTDGHHRIMALHSNGHKNVEVRLYDLDGDTQVHMPLLTEN